MSAALLCCHFKQLQIPAPGVDTCCDCCFITTSMRYCKHNDTITLFTTSNMAVTMSDYTHNQYHCYVCTSMQHHSYIMCQYNVEKTLLRWNHQVCQLHISFRRSVWLCAYIHYKQIVFCQLKFWAAASRCFDSSHITYSAINNTSLILVFMCKTLSIHSTFWQQDVIIPHTYIFNLLLF